MMNVASNENIASTPRKAFAPAPFMSPAEAAHMTTMSKSLLRIMSEGGQFPRMVPIGVKRVAYVRAEVEAWISGRIANRSKAAA